MDSNMNDFAAQLESQVMEQWNSTFVDVDQDNRSGMSSSSTTSLISPTTVSMDAFSQATKDMISSGYMYNSYGKLNSSSSGSLSTSASGSHSNSFQNDLNTGMRGDLFSFDTGFHTNYMLGYQDLSNDYGMTNPAALQANPTMFGNYDYTTPNTNIAPTSAPPQALFQKDLQNIPIDQAPVYTTTYRSPSPLFEVDETDSSSPELIEVEELRRVVSETLPTQSQSSISKRRGYSITLPHPDRNHLDPEEKAARAAAGEGLNKGDKRRMQNKLAQRAFRARSKIVTHNAAGRLEHLEELTEQQEGRIGNLNELVGRLQRENYALKSTKFQEAMLKGGMR